MFRGGFLQICYRTSPILKTGIMVHSKHEFLPLEPFFVFRNEHAQPKLTFGWFRTISLPHITHSENGYHGAFKA
jgi:hypothetical protein